MKQLKIFRICIDFATAILINHFCCSEKVFILMNIYIAGKNLMKLQKRLKKLFTTRFFWGD